MKFFFKKNDNKPLKNHKITKATGPRSEASKKQLKLRIALSQKQTADYYYLIDVVGTCNLKCPSCPVGNYQDKPIGVGQMSLEKYQSILDKIEREKEHPEEKIFIDLYNWGEPGLHKQLSDIISLTKARGMGVGISTNLNYFPDIKNVVKSSPDYIRISLSGFYNSTYKKTHRHGDINIVKSNMHLLRHYIDKIHSDTIVQVGFHIYKTNFPDDFLKMEMLCHELDFIFAPVIASLMPAEKALLSVQGEDLSQDKELIDKLVITPQERKELYKPVSKGYTDCEFRAMRTTINFDGSVPLCCATYEREQIIAKDFLEHSKKNLKQLKYQHPFCKQCMSQCLHMNYTDAESGRINELAAERLGPIYSDFLKSWQVPLNNWVDWEGQEYSSQEAFDAAFGLESVDAKKATLLYQTLLLAFPRHGEALYRLGLISEANEDWTSAAAYYQRALRIAPDIERYREGLEKATAASKPALCLVNALHDEK